MIFPFWITATDGTTTGRSFSGDELDAALTATGLGAQRLHIQRPETAATGPGPVVGGPAVEVAAPVGGSNLQPFAAPSPAGKVNGDGTAESPQTAVELDGSGTSGLGGEELTEEEQQKVQELKFRDREVRQHEQAHMAAAGGHAHGGPSHEYTTGPDNRRYAT